MIESREGASYFCQFIPVVDVYDNGFVDVDWGDSFSERLDAENAKPGPQPTGDELDGILLDRIFEGCTTQPERLRRLADYMEGKFDPFIDGLRQLVAETR